MWQTVILISIIPVTLAYAGWVMYKLYKIGKEK